MKLKRQITPAERNQLAAVRDKLSEALATTAKRYATVKELHGRIAKLDGMHAELEGKASGGSLEASQKLHGVLDQKRRTNEAIQAEEAQSSNDLVALRPRVNDAQDLVSRLCAVDLCEQIADALETTLAPYVADPMKARRFARETDAYLAIGQYFNGPLEVSLVSLTDLGNRYVDAIERLLSGDDVWSFSNPSVAPAPAAAAA
jgi:hypothetical protein